MKHLKELVVNSRTLNAYLTKYTDGKPAIILFEGTQQYEPWEMLTVNIDDTEYNQFVVHHDVKIDDYIDLIEDIRTNEVAKVQYGFVSSFIFTLNDKVTEMLKEI